MRNKVAKRLKRECMSRDEFKQFKGSGAQSNKGKCRIWAPGSPMNLYRLSKRFYK